MGNKHTVDAHAVDEYKLNCYLNQLKNIDEEVYNTCKKYDNTALITKCMNDAINDAGKKEYS